MSILVGKVGRGEINDPMAGSLRVKIFKAVVF